MRNRYPYLLDAIDRFDRFDRIATGRLASPVLRRFGGCGSGGGRGLEICPEILGDLGFQGALQGSAAAGQLNAFRLGMQVGTAAGRSAAAVVHDPALRHAGDPEQAPLAPQPPAGDAGPGGVTPLLSRQPPSTAGLVGGGDVDPPAGETGRQPGVLTVLADRQRQLLSGHADVGGAGVGLDLDVEDGGGTER